MKTTLHKIKQSSPDMVFWRTLLTDLGKTKSDDEPLDIVSIYNSAGIFDTLWCLRTVDGFDREKRLFAVWCAKQLSFEMKDMRSLRCIYVAEKFANGDATEQELKEARDAAGDFWVSMKLSLTEKIEVEAAYAAFACADTDPGFASYAAFAAAAGGGESARKSLCEEFEKLLDKTTKRPAPTKDDGMRPVAWAKFQGGEMTHMEMSDGSGCDFDLKGFGYVPLYTAPPQQEKKS